MKFVLQALVLLLPLAQAQRDGNELMALVAKLNMLNDAIRPAVDAAYNGTGNSMSAKLNSAKMPGPGPVSPPSPCLLCAY